MIRRLRNRATNYFEKYFKEDYKILNHSIYFDKRWYKKKYDVKGDPILHYIREGHKLGYFPSLKFSRIKYELIYDDVRYVHANPVVHFEKYGKYEPYFLEEEILTEKEEKELRLDKKLQDDNIRLEYDKDIKKLIVFLVPDVDTIGGGVMSINSIATISKKYKELHGSEVILCTVPSKRTFFEYSKFKCNFNIYRFDQLEEYFTSLEDIMFHIPEIYVDHFLKFSSVKNIEWVKSIKHTSFNIMNQNMDFMPRPRLVEYLKEITDEVTITCAHKQYCTRQLRTSYDSSVHWLSASNMVKYEYVDYENKEDLLLYSPDLHPMKEMILNKIKNAFPKLKMKEIKNLEYKDYLKLIGKAKWMITFGEGLDGYFLESLRSGTMAFSTYNLTFFNEKFKDLENVYANYNKMFENIVDDMKKFDDKTLYRSIVKKCIKLDHDEYNDSEYENNIAKFYEGDYTFPINELIKKRNELIERQPLISIALAAYNGEKYIKEQIDSLLKLDYKNIEIVVSDDHSTDNTFKILKKYGNKIKLIQNNGKKGLNNNFINAIKNCRGEFIALSDQDDIWEKDKLNILLEHIDDFDIIHGGLSVIDEKSAYYDNKAMHVAYESNKVSCYKFSDFIKSNEILGCTTLIRKSFLDKYLDIPEGVIYHDWWFSLNAIKNGNGVVYVDKELIKYRQHGNNTAFKTYNNNSWYTKKIKFNHVIENVFALDECERLLLDIDTNYNKLKKVFIKYIPTLSEEYFNLNYNYFIDDFVQELIDELKEEGGKNNEEM